MFVSTRHTMMMNTKNNLIPNPSQPGITMILVYQMLYTKFQDHRSSGSGEVFSIHGHCDHLGHVHVT